jgi:hypothetical protein
MENRQESLNLFSGEHNRDIGMQQALDNANRVEETWSEKAYSFLLSYIKNNKTFMTEEVRIASEEYFAPPPSNRAWGAIIVKAVKNGLISRIGYKSVTNPKAHCTPAAVWQVK